MLALEVVPNANCEPVDLRIFEDLEPPHAVSQVRLERDQGHPAWYAVTGWTADAAVCPAIAQKVSDSGAGTVYLIRGGNAGLRLRPLMAGGPWTLSDPAQWGESFLLLDATDWRP